MGECCKGKMFMTAQIHDKVLLDGKMYDIFSSKGKGLITPQLYGIYPKMIDKVSFKDHFSEYWLINDCLVLAKMRIGETKRTKKIKGISPDEDNTYNNVDLWARFTGNLQIVRELIEGQDPLDVSSYKTAKEIFFEDGEVMVYQDISNKVSSR